jgi:hypothetical protein
MGKTVVIGVGSTKEIAPRNILIKKGTNKAREAVMQSGKRKEVRQVETVRERRNVTVCSLEMNFKLVCPSFKR